ncbi:MAG TPA: DUF2971 domain-containing protein [Thermoanaerobaculia bacterium]|nr:DUF2971 domain-containing protein [Thermoanaerobaculia bacterium]
MTDEEFDRELLALRASVENSWHAWQGPAPSEVFHYTNALASSKIIESGKLWAVISSELNDRSEIVHAADTLRQLLFDRLRSDKKTDQALRILYPPGVRHIRLEEGGRVDVFVASLTRLENDLTQWDRYADRAYGVALGFDSHALRQMDNADEAASAVGFVRVAYDRSDQDTFFETLVERWLEQVAPRMSDDLATVPDAHMYIASWLGNLAGCAAAFFPRMKRKDFQAENEWRLVHGHLMDSPDCVVTRSGVQKTHVELDLRIRDRRMPLTSVWLAPGIANRESERRMRRLLDRCGYNSVPVTSSTIPLRIENKVLVF